MEKKEREQACKSIDAAIADMEKVRDQAQSAIDVMKKMRDTITGQTKLKVR